MADAKCRCCDHAAGANCSSCAADIMANALNSFFGRMANERYLGWSRPGR